ncbi:unnamed protein product [Closterium sp. NIES-64]|nr:unnamed protein product [Closterium sp. NIES-64]
MTWTSGGGVGGSGGRGGGGGNGGMGGAGGSQDTSLRRRLWQRFMGGDEAEKQQNSDKEHGGIGMGVVLERREERREKIAREFVPLDRLDHEDGGLRGFANGLSRKETGGGGGGVADSRASESSGSGGGSSGGNNNGGAAVAGATGEGEGGVDKTDRTGSGDGRGEQLGSNGKGKKEAVQTQLDGDDIPLLMPLKGLFKSKDLDEEIKEEEEEERKKGERGAERKRQVARREFRSDDWSHLGETRPGLSSSESGAGGGGGANTTGVAGTAAGDGVTRDSTETSHSASAASNGASQATAGTTASSSATKEGEHGTHMPSVTKTNETSGEKGGDVGQLVGRILDRLDDMEDEGGKFNKTLEKQEAVLETVARVGKHHVLEEVKEREQREEQEDRQVLEEAEREEAQEKMKQLEQVALAMAAAEAEKKAKKKGVAAVAAVVSQGVKASEVSLFDLVFGRDSSGKQPPPVSPSPSLRTKNLTRLAAAKKRFAERAGRGAREKERSERVDEGENDVPRLIDSQDNEYVISSPGKGSKMQLQEDFMLISDVVKVIVAAALGGLACGLVGQPIILGYIVAGMIIGPGGFGLIHELVQPIILGYMVAGMIIGPGGFGLIHELVQVETLAQFGVVFLLFAIGVEFSLARMQGVHAVALAGGIIQIGLSMVLGGIVSSNTPQGLFIGGFLSMSSTAVVLKCLMDINSMGTEHGQIMLGTLISQDCALGLLLAIMPALAARPASASAILLALLRELLILLAFALIAWLLARFFVPRFLPLLLRLARGSFNSEIYHLGVVAVCLCVALLSEGLGLSLEVGAFVAGLMLSGNPYTLSTLKFNSLPHSCSSCSPPCPLSTSSPAGNSYSERTLHQVEPIRNLFAALFLASIGMVMHPLFLWQHIDILLIAVAVVFVSKACLVGFVVSGGEGWNGMVRVVESLALCHLLPPGSPLFLASIGMVMHPLFLWQHIDILLSAVAVVFVSKACLVGFVHIDILLIAVAVVFVSKACLVGFVVRSFGYSTGTAASVGVALAQIGEFSFVLLSRAQTLKLVGHKLYLLLMGTTALSLVLTPFTFLFVPRLALLFPSTRSRPRAKASASPAPAAAQEKIKSGYGIKSAAVNGVQPRTRNAAKAAGTSGGGGTAAAAAAGAGGTAAAAAAAAAASNKSDGVSTSQSGEVTAGGATAGGEAGGAALGATAGAAAGAAMGATGGRNGGWGSARGL